MDRFLERKRLLVRLGDRHHLAVIAIVAPAGFGKSVLLGQALSEGPSRVGDRDVSYACGSEDELEVSNALAAAVAEALQSSRIPGRHVALMIDNVERIGSDGEDLLRDLLDRSPPRCHLVIAGRRLPRIGLASRVADGTGVIIDIRELAFAPDELSTLGEMSASQNLSSRELATWPALASLILKGREELVVDYIDETVLAHTDPAVVDAIAAISSVAGCQDASLEAVISAALEDGVPQGPSLSENSVHVGFVMDRVRRLPLVDIREGIWPHPIWSAVTDQILTPRQRERIAVAKVRGLLEAGAIHEAGHQATISKSHAALSLVVRSALSSQPPRASVADLRAWACSDLMSRNSTEAEWLRTVVDLQLGDSDATGRRRLEQVRQAFEAAGDEEAEISVLFHLGIIARANSDTAALSLLLERGAVLATGGNPLIKGLVALGHAVAAQLAGDPRSAIARLEQIPPGLLTGEWASQALMMRGTNLLLAGHVQEALNALHNSTGEGSDATRSIAHDLLSTAKWYSGDWLGAIEDAEISESLALSSGTTRVVQQRRAWKACLLAATNQIRRARHVLEQLDAAALDLDDEETRALTAITQILLLIADEQLDEARKTLEATKTASRATRSSMWKKSIEVALDPGSVAAPQTGIQGVPAAHAAVAAGVAAGQHLAGAAPASRLHRAYLPACWIEPTNTVAIKLAGACGVSRNGSPIDHPAWGRIRVRELCLHLSLTENQSRSLVASALWPDLPDRDAGRNLRVTLTHLLDVLDPDRRKSAGSRFIVETDGSLVLNRKIDLRLDVWDFERHANAVLTLPDHERPALLAHARRMVSIDHGPLLAGAVIGEWVEPYRRRRDELRVNASLRAGRHALAAADNRLAETLGLSALEVDPWSEQAHSLVIESRIYAGDVDGARRAFKQALAAFDDLGVTSRLATSALSFRLGL